MFSEQKKDSTTHSTETELKYQTLLNLLELIIRVTINEINPNSIYVVGKH